MPRHDSTISGQLFRQLLSINRLGLQCSHFTKVALAYGIDSISICQPEEIETGLAKLWEGPINAFQLKLQ